MQFYEVFTYGNGQLLIDILNAIASIMDDDGGYSKFIGMAVSIAFGTLILTCAFDLKFEKAFKWYAMVMCVYSALILPKVTVLVTDPAIRNIQDSVEGVPLGLAYLLSTLTSIEYGLTTTLETAFHVPDDLSYNKAGMMMASDMVRKASSFKIQDQNLSKNVQSFIRQCIQYDILHGKYTVSEIFNSGNIWEFAAGYASPARAFIYNGDIVTCRDGVSKLTADWQTETNASMHTIGARIFGTDGQKTPEELLSQYLMSSYRHLAELSSTASEIMQQNMMVNAFHDAVINNAAELGAAAAVESYAVARATQNSRSAYKISGEVAGRLLIYLKNTIQLLLVGAFVIIVPLFFLTSGVMRIKHYIEILASLSLWGPLYAILNLQMTSHGRWRTLGLTAQPDASNKTAITIANLPGIEQIAADQAILAGYLALSIPLIAYGLVKSSMYAFSSLASGVMGVAQSSAGGAAEEATTGNYSLGNVSLENTNAYNTSSFHDDSNARVSSGSAAVQAMDGTWNTIFSNGGEKTDHREAMSNMATSVNYGTRMEAALQKGYHENTSATEAQTVEYTQTMSGVIGDMYEYSKARGNASSSTETDSLGHSSSHNDAFSRVQGMVDTVMEQTGASEKEAYDIVANAYVGGRGLPLNAGLSASASNSASIENSEFISTSGTDSQSVQTTIDDAKRASHDLGFTSSSDEQNRLAENIRTGVDQSEALRESRSTSMQRAENAQTALTALTANSATLSSDGTQHVYEELRKTINPQTGRNYENPDISKMISDPNKFEAVIMPIIEKDAAAIINKGVEVDNKTAGIEGKHHARNQEIHSNGDQILTKHEVKKDELNNQAKIKPVDNALKTEVSAKLNGNVDKISDAKNMIQEKDNVMREGVNAEIQKSTSIKAKDASLSRIKDTLGKVGDWVVDDLTGKHKK